MNATKLIIIITLILPLVTFIDTQRILETTPFLLIPVAMILAYLALNREYTYESIQ